MKTPILRAAFSTAFGSGQVWNMLMPKGEFHGANLAPIGGAIVIDDSLLAEIVANWKDAGSPPLPIRKTHRHLDDNVPAVDRLELEKAYGFLTDMRVTAQGLEVKTDWNPAGKAEVDSGSFAFWSPEWQPKHRDRRTGDMKGWWLSGTALTNDPFFNEMPPVAASIAAATTDTTPAKDTPMNPALLKRMKAALKCADDSSDDDLTAAVEKLACATFPAQTNTTAVASAITEAVAPVNARLVVVEAENVRLTAAMLERDIDAAIEVGKRGDGKLGRAITPELRTFIVASGKSGGIEEAKKLIAALPLSVPVVAIGHDSKPEGGTLTAADATQKLAAIRDENVKAGMGRVDAMEMAMLKNPDLAAQARSLTATNVAAAPTKS